jgi:Fur family transcriptional regulator, ferric uptake regulator
MTTPPLTQKVERRLRDKDIRYTPARRAVVNALGDSDGPRSAADLSVHLIDVVPLSSLYRSLSVLEDAGVVTTHHSTKGLTRYELAEWLTGHHHHLVCVECGQVEDIEIPERFERQVEEVVREIGSAVSFSPINHALEIAGRCKNCGS